MNRLAPAGTAAFAALPALFSIALLTGAGSVAPVRADHTPNPSTVTIPGSLQSEVGCANDWDPACALTHLTYDASDDVWQAAFTLPAGNWEYKAALNDSWSENYGLNAQQDGPNIGLGLVGSSAVKFYYDHKTHWVTSNVNSRIVTAPGSYQSETGCPGDWQPDCLRAWLQDTDGDGTFTQEVVGLPPGNYEVKAAINESWDENYGANGVQNGPNIPFSVVVPGSTVRMQFVSASNLLTVLVDAPVPAQAASWGRVKTIYR